MPISKRPRHADLWDGVKQGAILGAAVLALTLPPASVATRRLDGGVTAHVAGASVAAKSAAPRLADFNGHEASADARFIANWVADARDNRQSPFVILDKRDARVFAFDPNGRLIDSSPVLLGAAPGDDSVVGIGKRPIAQVRPEERTTPAGRFVARPGRNSGGEDVIWVDYEAAVSMHRVRPIDPKERRLQRLASPDPTQRRISYGCINVPVVFFEKVLHPLLGTRGGIVYVLPETRELRQVFANAYPVDRTATAKL
jgi:hypothetical protein